MASWKKKQYFKGMLFKRASLVVLCAALATPFAVAQEDVEPAQEEIEEDETSVLGAITVTAQNANRTFRMLVLRSLHSPGTGLRSWALKAVSI